MLKNKNSSKNHPEIDFNEEYKKYSIEQLGGIEDNLENIIENIKKFKKEINFFFNNFNECCTEFIKEIQTYIKWLKESVSNYNDKKNENIEIHNGFIKNFSENFKKCNGLFEKMDNENYMDKIYNLNNEIKKSINGIVDLQFYPHKCENINNSIISLSLSTYESDEPFHNNISDINEKSLYKKVDNFADDYLNEDSKGNYLNENNNNIREINKIKLNNAQYIEENIEEKKNILKCSYCLINNAIYKCFDHCDKIFCEGCHRTISDFEQNSDHKFKKLEENKLDKETAKALFLQNFIEFIKFYILKCNYLLNLEDQNYNFPIIENINDNDLESQINYLNKIIGISKNMENDEENEKKINGNLVTSLEHIFIKKQLHISKESIDNEDDFFSDENCTKAEIEFDKIKDNLVYLITVVAKEKMNIENDFSDVIISRIAESLSINKNNIFILLNDKIDNFVKSQRFGDLPLNQIQFENPIFNNFKDVKLLIEQFLCNECRISKDYFDYKGNCLNPNLSYNIKRGTEIYDPPYGWKAIGLKIEGKYDNNDWLENKTSLSEWAIAYHGISQRISEEANKKIIKYIITKNGIKNAISKMKSNSNDKRNWGKVGDGIYLSPKIKTAENYTGIISFNNKKYKVLFMAKVLIKGIREPEYSNFWVLNEKDIRIYRILFKEIN